MSKLKVYILPLLFIILSGKNQNSKNISIPLFYYDHKEYTHTHIIEGRIKKEKYYGPPNYGETPEIDQKRTAIILVLKSKICVLKDPKLNYIDPTKYDTVADEIHLAPSASGMKFSEGENVKVQGSFYSGYTGYHQRDLLMLVSKKY